MLNKRFLSLLLCLTMILTCFSGYAADVDNQTTEIYSSDEQAVEEIEGANATDVAGPGLYSSSGVIDDSDITWSLTNSGMLTIEGSGEMKDFALETIPWADSKDDVKFLYISDGITSIGDYAFYGLSKLKSVYIPEGVTDIGTSAFEKCDKLKEISLPDSLITIGEGAFRYCSSLRSFDVPSQVTYIGTNAFSNTEKLDGIFVSSDNENYSDIDGVLFNKDATELICYPDGMKENEYKLPESVTAIAEYAFDDCSNLSSVDFGDKLESIADNAFYGCSDIESVNIPASVTYIAHTAFLYGCDSLKAINVDEANEVYSSEMGVLFDKAKTKLIRFPSVCDEPVDPDEGIYEMPNTVTVIGQEAFLGCQTIEFLWIYGALEKIEMAAFMSFDTLLEIWFDGTQYNWDLVEKGIYNEKLDEITVLPMEGDLKDEFNAKVGVTYYLEEFVDLKGNESILENLVVSSSDTNVAVVDKEKMTAISEGTAIITAVVIKDGMVYAASVKVNVTANGAGGSENSFHLVKGETLDLRHALSVPDSFLDSLIWTSTNKNVVTVDNGLVTAEGPGTATVIATVNSSDTLNYSVKCKITVEPKYTDEKYFKVNGSSIIGYNGPDTEVSIPPVINGVKIDEISTRAFKDVKHITKVEMPTTITKIGDYAFYGCTALSNIKLHKGITYLGNYAFGECDSLIKMTIPATVTNVGSYWFRGSGKLSTVTFAEGIKTIGSGIAGSSIKSVVIPSTVTQINYAAFAGCTSLTSVNIPDNVTKIGASAFENCYSLKTVTIGKKVTYIDLSTFANCKKLRNVTIGSGVKSIGSYAFEKCTSLTEITIPNNVTSIYSESFAECEKLNNINFGSGLVYIGSYAFSYCSALKNVTLPQSLKTIEEYGFYCSGLESVAIPDSVTFVGKYAFAYNKALTDVVIGSGLGSINGGVFSGTAIKSINIPDNITSILIDAFYNCNELSEVTFNNVRTIGVSAFSRCAKLTSIQLPDTLKMIEDYAFAHTAISSVVIPDSVTTIGESIFYGCASLTEATIGSGLTNIANNMFNGCDSIRKITIAEGITKIDDEAFSRCTTLTDIVIPDTVTSIGDSAFYNCSNLRNVKLSKNLQTIGAYAFSACYFLENIDIPDTVTTIGSYAFNACQRLKSIDIPDSVTRIGERGFGYCYALEQVKLSNNLKAIDDETFYKCTSLKEIVIPDSVERVDYYAFAYCSELSSVTLGANISYFGTNVFYGCDKLSFSGGIPAAVAKYMLSKNLFGSGDMNIIHKYFDGENTSYIPLNDAMVGYFEMQLKYKVKDGINPSKKTIKVNLPHNAYVLPGTMMIDGELLGEGEYKETENAQYGYNYIEIPVENNSGVLTFCIKPTEYTMITTYAEMTMRINGSYVTEFLGYSNCSLPEVTISAPDVVGSDEFIVEGITIPNCSVSLWVEGNRFSTYTKSSRTGSYKTTLKIEKPENYKEYEISVSVLYRFNDMVDGTKSYYTDTKIQYVSNTPSLDGFDMYYGKNGYTKTKYDLFNATTRPKIRWGDYMSGRGRGYSYYFALDIENNENVDNVYVVSTRNNKKSYLEAVWNEYSQRYETSGYFDDNCEYIPGVLTVEYVKGDADIRMNLSDIGTYLNYDSEAFSASVTDYTTSNYSAVVAVGEALQEIFGKEIDVAVETVDRDYAEGVEDELFEERFNYYAYAYENEFGRYVISFDISDIGKAVVNLHDITNAKQTSYTMNFVNYDEESIVSYIDVSEIISRISEYSGKLLNVYDINIDTDKLIDKLYVSGLPQEDIDTGIIIAENLKIKKQMFLLLSTVLSVSSVDGISAPSDVIDCIVGSISKDVSFFRYHRLMSIFRIGSESKIRWMIDPSGYVYEGVTENRLEGVTVTAFCVPTEKIPVDAQGNLDFDNINPEDVMLWDASELEQENPIVTDSTGEYKWDVPDGYYWQVEYKKDGYETSYSDWLPVPPVQTDVNIGLVATTAPVIENVNLTTDYMVLTFDKYIKPDTVNNVKVGDAKFKMEYDNTKTDADGNVYAKEFTFKFTESLPTGTDYTVSVDGAQSYAGKAMEAYSDVCRTPGEPLPKELILTTEENKEAKTISLAYHNNTVSDMVVNIACVIYDENGDIVKIEMLGNESINVGAKIDRVFSYDSSWDSYKVFTWYSSSLSPATALFDSAIAQ